MPRRSRDTGKLHDRGLIFDSQMSPLSVTDPFFVFTFRGIYKNSLLLSSPVRELINISAYTDWRKNLSLTRVIIHHTLLDYADDQRCHPWLVPDRRRRRGREHISGHAFHDHQALPLVLEYTPQPHLSPSRRHTSEDLPSPIPVHPFTPVGGGPLSRRTLFRPSSTA